jgi:hypothetical protein
MGISQGLPKINLPSIANCVCSRHCPDIHPCSIESPFKFHQSSNEIPLLFYSQVTKGRKKIFKIIYLSSTILFLDECFEEILLSPIVGQFVSCYLILRFIFTRPPKGLSALIFLCIQLSIILLLGFVLRVHISSLKLCWIICVNFLLGKKEVCMLFGCDSDARLI